MVAVPTYKINQAPNTIGLNPGVRIAMAKLCIRKGNSPEPPAKVPKSMLKWQRMMRLSDSQDVGLSSHSFKKECVITHWSVDMRRQYTGLSIVPKAADQYCTGGRRSFLYRLKQLDNQLWTVSECWHE